MVLGMSVIVHACTLLAESIWEDHSGEFDGTSVVVNGNESPYDFSRKISTWLIRR